MRSAAIAAGRCASLASRLFAMGGGTSLPGLIAERLHPALVRDLAARFERGSVAVTGTNGKTTTTKMLAGVLRHDGLTVVSNDSGSNLRRGIASALVQSARLAGGPATADVAVFEVDEPTMPGVVGDLAPRAVAVTNFGRDQLDRFGELDTIVELVGGCLAGRPETAAVLNADDPRVAGLAARASGQVVYFGVDDPRAGCRQDSCAEAAHCPRCGGELAYRVRYLGHCGDWHCPRCGLARPPLDFAATGIAATGRSSAFELRTPDGPLRVTLPVPALYNVYDAVAAAAAATVLGVSHASVAEGLASYTAAFGRMETLTVDGREVMLLLAKNPISAGQALSVALSEGGPRRIALVLNDNAADSRDVSWTWDVDFEEFELSACSFVASGTRAEEMALRLKYAGVPSASVLTEPDPVAAVRALAAMTPAGETAFVLPTYTAMIEIRNAFARRRDGFSRLGRLMKRGL
jgi:UDP-N-acetylmuramyl tripeptide synthase